jgi:hypothetical protein
MEISNDVAGRVQLHIWQAQRSYHPIPATFSRTQLDEQHLVFVVFDDVTQGALQLNLFRRIQIAFEHRELKVIPKVGARFKNPPQPLVVGDVVTNQVCRAHGMIAVIPGME